MPVSQLRAAVDLALSPSGSAPERFAHTPAADRQILADAEEAGATLLVTENVDDFAAADPRSAGVSAVDPDLFLAERADEDTYRHALDVMVAGMRSPSRTPAQLHSAIARQHPRLFDRHRDLFDIESQETGHKEPAVLYCGVTCLRCLTELTDESDLIDGLGPECRKCE